MPNQNRNPALIVKPLRLPAAEDYLGQWLLALAEHYPIPEMTQMATVGYRVALEELTPQELDLAFVETFKRHPKDFRPTSGEIRAYLHDAREDNFTQERRALPEARLSSEEAKEVLREIRSVAKTLKPSELELTKNAVDRARKEIKEIRKETGTSYTIELTEEELTQRKEQLKTQALDWWENNGDGKTA